LTFRRPNRPAAQLGFLGAVGAGAGVAFGTHNGWIGILVTAIAGVIVELLRRR
jgi:hypothetical protein